MGDELAKPVEDMKGDAHNSRAISCSGCHGGNPSAAQAEQAMNPAKGFIAQPVGKDRITMCARCHSDPQFMKKYNPTLRVDQADLYWTSIHGKRLMEGDPKVATCTSCHGYHKVYPPTDSRSSVYPTHVHETCGKCHSNSEHMKQYGIPINQVEEYKHSVHGVKLLENGDLASPTCNDCHGNHGATPPGIKSLAYVCSRCHPIQQELFTASPHGRALEQYGKPSCDDCHHRHKIVHPTDDMIGVGEGAVCATCHSEGDNGWQVAQAMRAKIDGLKEDIAAADNQLTQAEDNGMPSVDARYDLSQAESLLVQIRTLIHSFSLSVVDSRLTEADAKARSARDAARKFFDEIVKRKAGLWITWLFIVLFSIGILIKIQELRKKDKPQ